MHACNLPPLCCLVIHTIAIVTLKRGIETRECSASVLPPGPFPLLPPVAQQNVSKSPCEAQIVNVHTDGHEGMGQSECLHLLAHCALHTLIGLEAACSGHVHCITAEGRQVHKLTIVRVLGSQVSTGWCIGSCESSQAIHVGLLSVAAQAVLVTWALRPSGAVSVSNFDAVDACANIPAAHT